MTNGHQSCTVGANLQSLISKTMNPNQESSQNPIAEETYNQHGENYSAMAADNIYNAMYERPAILNLLPDLQGLRVLDAGCGSGFHSEWMVERGAQITVVDVSETMLALAKQRLGDRVTFHQHDLAKPLTFLADQSQDIVLSSMSIHYILDLQALFMEYARVLAENGRFIFSTGHSVAEHHYFQREDYFVTELIDDEWQLNGSSMPVKYYVRPLSAITTALAQAGFWIENIVEPQPLVEAEERFPDRYEFLAKNPWFIIFQTRKKGR